MQLRKALVLLKHIEAKSMLGKVKIIAGDFRQLK